jgi:hypothetical protein
VQIVAWQGSYQQLPSEGLLLDEVSCPSFLATSAAPTCSGSMALRPHLALRSPLAAGGSDHHDQSSTPTIRLASAIDVIATTIGSQSLELPPPGESIQRP